MTLKKILLLAAFALPLTSFSQSSEKGTITVSAGAGLGIYNTQVRLKDSTKYQNDKAAAWVFPVVVDYFITDQFSVGASLKYGKYIHNDSTDKNLDAHAIEFMLRPAYHFINKNKINMSVYADLGFSDFKYNTNNTLDQVGKGFGGLFGAGLNTQLYFTKGFGMFFNFNYYMFTYNNFTVTDNIPSSKPTVYKYKFDGANYVLGFMYKIK